MKKALASIFILLLLLVSLAKPVRAQSNIQVINDAASLTFPNSLEFQAEFQSGADITSVVLEYGSNQLTCGTVEARAFPTMTPAPDVKVQWTWDMRQAGSLPPGSTVWWRWQVSDASGAQFTSPQKTVLWLDNIHPWQVITGGKINLHYYDGGTSFGQQLHDAAVKALQRLSQDVGVGTDSPVDIYIYASQNDLLEAVLYDPSWAAGQAFAENDIVIIGVSPDQLDWGMSTEAHELTHVLVGHLTFTCLGFIPHWLNEGLAVYGEGGRADYEAALNQAIPGNTLTALRSLSGNFPDTDLVTLAYGESYSVVSYLLKTYGRDKMTKLLLDLRDGQTADQALQAVYGFDTDGLEDVWRRSIGAAPRSESSQSTPVATPTEVPTFVPIGAAPVARAATSTPQPATVLATPTPTVATQTAAPTPAAISPAKQPGLNFGNLTTVIEFALACLIIAVLLAGLAIFLIVRHQSRRIK